MPDLLRVSAYCRVSTEKEDQLNSLASQIKYFTDYIKQQGNWAMGEVFYDEGISGTSVKKRAGFQRMIQEAKKGRMDLILTKEVSRFARNTVDTLSYTRKLSGMGIGVIFTLDHIDTRESDGELRLTIMASLAQEESRKTSARVKWGHQRRMEQGVVFGRDLLGYSVREGKLSLNEAEAEIVRLIFHKYLAEGKGTHVIARELQEAGIMSMREKYWSNTAILRVLRNEKYVGDLRQKKTYTPDYLTHAKKYNRGQEAMVYLKDHHEPIISRDTWEAAQKELTCRAMAEERKAKYSNRYWCSGKLICGTCGARLVSRTKKRKDGSIYQAWRCHAAARHGRAKSDRDGNSIGCDNGSVNEKVLLYGMSYVMKHIHDIQTNKDKIIKDMIKELKKISALMPLQKIDATAPNQPSDIVLLRQKQDLLIQKKRKVIDLVLEELISKEDFIRQTEYYNQAIKTLAQQIVNAGQVNANQVNSISTTPADPFSDIVKELQKLMDFDTHHELLYRELLDHISVYSNNELVIYLKYVPYGIRIRTVTSGKSSQYQIIIVQAGIESGNYFPMIES